MSWAEVKKINGDLATPLDEKISQLRQEMITVGKQVFTTHGTFVVPENVYNIRITACAGGGGGGSTTSSSSNYGGGGGGGGGSLIRNEVYQVTPGQSISITVGAGGSGGMTINNGGSTVIGDLVTLVGGTKGSPSPTGGQAGAGGAGGLNAGSGGSGGPPTSGTFARNGLSAYLGAIGGNGAHQGPTASSYPSGGGGGGGGSLGYGANGGGFGVSFPSYGGGGGGGGGMGVTYGGAGGSGIVIIEWGAVIK